jgi:hypothetical protein
VARRSRRAPLLTLARCALASSCTTDDHHIKVGGRLLLAGSGLYAGMAVVFRAQGPRPGTHSTAMARLRRTSKGWVATVPKAAVSGHIFVIGHYGRSPLFGPIYIVHKRRRVTPAPGTPPPSSPLDGNGMWIWHLDKSSGANPDAMARRAQRAHVSTLFIKSSDGSTNYWSQFSAATVSALKARGLKVCAWQYVYGTHPVGEATLGARAVSAGADCLVIDAEAEYEGRYSAAQTYVTELRSRIGAAFPLALASFPYVDFHPNLPYSVFLGPGAAQYNAPQMYWKAIGTSVDTVYAHTFTHNRIYGRPIFPLGQAYTDPEPSQIRRFRALAAPYGATGLSWWDWEENTARGWDAMAATITPSSSTPSQDYPLLSSGARGDEVVWLQQHLAAAAASTPTNGVFGSTTVRNLRTFQADHRLPVSGQSDPETWKALLALAPVVVDWTARSGG